MQPVCPSVGEWERFFSGEISDLDAGVLEAHLQSCETCRALLPNLSANDPLQQALRLPPPSAEKELVEGLIQRVKHLLQSSSVTPALSGKPSDDPDPFSETLNVGKEARLGQYRLVRPLGSGGMGLVYEAVDETLQRRVAVKIMAPKLAASATARQRFLREARAVAALDHPNIVHIYQVGDDNGTPYFVMEFLEGETLAERLLRTPRPTTQESAAIGREIAEGLAAAHAQGLIHRDIKPANVLLVSGGVVSGKEDSVAPPDGALDSPLTTHHSPKVKILDFGLVHDAEVDTRLTRVGDVLGTPGYMSPEQARGERVDHRADLFSLGCILYELCTGFTPFQAINSTALLLPTVADWPKPPSELNPNVPAAMSHLIVALLAKDAEQRPKSAPQVVATLRALEEGRDTIPTAVATTIPATSRRILVVTLASLMVFGIFVWFLSGWLFPRTHEEPLAGSWSKAKPLAQARANSMAVELDGQIYLLGGTISGPHLDTLEVLDPATGVWKSLARFPRTDKDDPGRSAASVGVIDGKIHVAGGWRHKPGLPTTTLLIYDPRSDSWEVGKEMPARSGGSVGGVIGRKFYVLIGSNGFDGIRQLFFAYDPDHKSWQELSPAPRPRYQAAGGVIGAKLYVVGGDTGQGSASGGLDVYDPATDTWTSHAPMPTPRTLPAAAVLNGKLVVLGGADKGALATVEAYDPATDRWTTLPGFPEPRDGAAAAVTDTSLYLFGGQRNDAKLASVDVFTLFPKSR